MPDKPADHEPAPRKQFRLRRLLHWKIAVPLLLLVAAILAPVVYRQSLLWRVPAIGDPFPVSEVLQPIPEADNAFPLFQEAFALRIEVVDEDVEEYAEQNVDGWDSADHQLSRYLELNRPALEKWRQATERNDCQFAPFSRIADRAYVTELLGSRDLSRWCQREIERLTKMGRPAEALPWLRAAFRSSALVTRHAPSIDRLTGVALFAISARSAELWIQHPDVTADELLDLLAVVQESARLMEKPSTAVKLDYVVLRREYAEWSYDEMRKHYAEFNMDPPLRSRFHAWLRAEPEFSRRLLAHVIANHLLFVDVPRRERPPILDGEIFDESAVSAAPAGRLPAQELIKLLRKSELIHADIGGYLDGLDRHEARSACLQVAVVAQAYYRENGKFPGSLADLCPDFLSSLPDDPYAPQPAPVIYRRTGDKAVVYSCYTNENDDGGTEVTFDEAGDSDGPADFGFRIRRPGTRD